MIVVLDTNALLETFPKKAKYHWVFQYFLDKKFTLAVSTEVLLEYQEIIAQKTNESIATNVVNGILRRSNTIRIEPSFFWNLIEKDPDDNKFTDLYVAAGADLLVSNNTKNFKVLGNIEFPPIRWLTVKQMKKNMFV
ncbi:MAG: putative toxin-antitoxin system toxin component, PIN family [Cyclobacteriaceae bacterium]